MYNTGKTVVYAVLCGIKYDMKTLFKSTNATTLCYEM
jgi:hypothetical protein